MKMTRNEAIKRISDYVRFVENYRCMVTVLSADMDIIELDIIKPLPHPDKFVVKENRQLTERICSNAEHLGLHISRISIKER